MSFLSYDFDPATKALTIKVTDPATIVKGVYQIEAVFSAPGVYSWSLGLHLTVFDICDSSTFPSAPVLDPVSIDYMLGQADVSITTNWAEDSVSK